MSHKQFRKTAIYASVVAASLLVTGSVMAASVPGGSGTLRPMISIKDSWHNLGSGNDRVDTPSGGSPVNKSNDTAEICVFCHTPHGGDVSAAVPIWNRKLSEPGVYTRYSSLGTTTFDAEEAPIGSVTIACLSCHDGTLAIDALINAPGSGFFNAAGDVRIGNGFIGDDQVDGKLAPGPSAGVNGIVQNLETDLSNDHPVSMQYGGGGITLGTRDGPTKDRDFVASANGNTPTETVELLNMQAPASSNLTTLWWIERTDSLIPGVRDRADVLMYTRLEAESGVPGGEQPFVECGSCHDPHNVDNPTFLRVSNGIPAALEVNFPRATGNSPSALCLTCHVK
ncbi:MAG: cytochrome c3 family protein [Gammaproteobacteria bacterium]|nr:cytochrome c3 family protein [Gammaproteobacteria bacterium]